MVYKKFFFVEIFHFPQENSKYRGGKRENTENLLSVKSNFYDSAEKKALFSAESQCLEMYEKELKQYIFLVRLVK